jgi:hypothetical protein
MKAISMSTLTVAASLRLLGAALLAAAAIAGCGGGDSAGPGGDGGDSATAGAEPTISAEEREYYDSLAEAVNTANEEIAAANQQRTDAFALAEGEREAAMEGSADAYAAAMEGRQAAISALVPPEALATQHSRLQTAADDAVTLAEELAAAVRESPPASEEEYGNLAFGLDAVSVTTRFRDACSELQLRAIRDGAGVEMDCR